MPLFEPIINDRVRSLIDKIDSEQDVDCLIRELIHQLTENCKKQEVRARYAKINSFLEADWTLKAMEFYPTDSDGYALSYDILDQEKEFFEAWTKYGFVVGKSVISKQTCQESVRRIVEILSQMSSGHLDDHDLSNISNLPTDSDGIPCISRGFFEIYHDDSLAQIRQALRVYLHHVVIWGRTDLWTTFDRFGVKLPEHPDSLGLPLHVDQNPTIHPDFKTVQGVLALVDCPIERGTFMAIPGSKNIFSEYTAIINEKKPGYVGEYVEAYTDTNFGKSLQGQAQCIPLRCGDLVSWDSRTTHANSTNYSNFTRFVAYISAGIAQPDNIKAVKERTAAFESGLGSNVREALMHASMRPRYTDPEMIQSVRKPEKLNLLGKLLYGQERYDNVA